MNLQAWMIFANAYVAALIQTKQLKKTERYTVEDPLTRHALMTQIIPSFVSSSDF